MKKTRQLILLRGKEEVVKTAFESIKGFKAVSILETADEYGIYEVFKNNKSVVTHEIEAKVNAQVTIMVTESDGLILGTSDFINIHNNVSLQFMQIAAKYGIDIGDHINDSANEQESFSKRNCVFCNLLKGIYDVEQRILYQSENFYVTPGTGAFMDGYLLLMPKKHIMSCAELDADKFQEMLQVLDDLRFILKAIYRKKVLVWENGSGQDGKGKPKTSIVHSHIHLCPSNIDIIETSRVAGILLDEIDCANLNQYKQNPYLLILGEDRYHIQYDKNVYVPRQYVRQLLALEMGVKADIWDWRAFPFWINLNKTADAILNWLRNSYTTLPTRIQKATEGLL